MTITEINNEIKRLEQSYQYLSNQSDAIGSTAQAREVRRLINAQKQALEEQIKVATPKVKSALLAKMKAAFLEGTDLKLTLKNGVQLIIENTIEKGFTVAKDYSRRGIKTLKANATIDEVVEIVIRQGL